MLKALQEDYDFIEISEEIENQQESMILNELEVRYKSFLENRTSKEWNTFLKEL